MILFWNDYRPAAYGLIPEKQAPVIGEEHVVAAVRRQLFKHNPVDAALTYKRLLIPLSTWEYLTLMLLEANFAKTKWHDTKC